MNPIVSAIAISIANFLVHGLVLSAFLGSDNPTVVGICYLVAVIDIGVTLGIVVGAVNIYRGEIDTPIPPGTPGKFIHSSMTDEEHQQWMEGELERLKRKRKGSPSADRLREMSEKTEEDEE